MVKVGDVIIIPPGTYCVPIDGGAALAYHSTEERRVTTTRVHKGKCYFKLRTKIGLSTPKGADGTQNHPHYKWFFWYDAPQWCWETDVKVQE